MLNEDIQKLQQEKIELGKQLEKAQTEIKALEETVKVRTSRRDYF